MTRLVDAGLVAEDWNQNEYNGIVENSVVVFASGRATRRTSRPGTT